MRTALVVGLAILSFPCLAQAATLQVGPTRTYKQLSEVRNLVKPGDVVEVDGNATYNGGLIFDKAGSAAQKITIRGLRVNGKRPVISGGANTIEARSSHYVFEALDITNGSSRCFFHHADDITIRDSVIHDCPKQGILGADEDSGSLLLEYSEVHHCGGGTQDHQVYMATDASVYANAVFRMQFCYVHDGNGGNNVKSRAARNEIFYNWVEGALYHELELIGSDGNPEGLVREDSDVVGNVLVKRNTFFVVRFGGDGTGQTNGRYRFVNNTVVVLPAASAVFRLFDGIDSLEAHNNVFAVRGTGNVNLVRQTEAVWVSGASTIAGQNNWIQTGATNVPGTFTGTINGAAPGFVNLAADDLRVATGSPLVNAGAATLAGPANHAFPNPLAAPLYMPPPKGGVALGAAEGRNNVGAIDIGAFELGGGGPPTAPPDGGTPSTSDGGTLLPDGGTASSSSSSSSGASSSSSSSSGGSSSSGSSGSSGAASSSSGGEDGDDASSEPGGCNVTTGGGAGVAGGALGLGIVSLLALRRRRSQRDARTSAR